MSEIALKKRLEEIRRLERINETLLRTLQSIVGNCEVYQGMESNMGAGDFLDLIEQDARSAIFEAKQA